MAIILRRDKGSTLTHDELDSNFAQLQVSNLDSAKVEALIDSAYIQQRVPETYLETIIDSAYVQDRVDSAYILGIAPAQDFLDSAEVINLVDSAYVQSRVTLRDSSFITGLIDSSHVTGLIDSHVTNLIDSSYISTRQSGGGLNIEFLTTTGSVTKVGTGDVFVEIAGGGGGTGSQAGMGGFSYGRGILNNVADGSVITVSAIGTGGLQYGQSSGVGGTGTSTTVYVDSANGQKIIMGGGGGGSSTRGGDATQPTASNGATALRGVVANPTGSFTVTSGFGQQYAVGSNTGNRSGFGAGGTPGTSGFGQAGGTNGAVLLTGV